MVGDRGFGHDGTSVTLPVGHSKLQGADSLRREYNCAGISDDSGGAGTGRRRHRHVQRLTFGTLLRRKIRVILGVLCRALPSSTATP